MKKITFLLLILLTSLRLFAQKAGSSILFDCKQADKTAKVVFFRPFKLIGSAVGFNLYHGDTLLTHIRSKSFYVAELPAGKNRITACQVLLEQHKDKNTIDLNLEPNKIYFIKCESKPISEGIAKTHHKLLFKNLVKKEVKQSLKKKFLRKQLKQKLYRDFYNQSTL
ncbi:MAG: hypothetical protein NVV82_27325 [Sporocytophaga sp.]|nr:hypothetical protein [Sporocytophaga sp.]